MIGAIVGDIVGSRFEFANYKYKDFELFTSENRFTDDTVVTCCVAESMMRSWEKDKFETLSDVAIDTLHEIGIWYPDCGFGGRFFQWMYTKPMRCRPYYSCGNGSAMRISPVIDIARSVEEAKDLAYQVTAITHNHSEGIKGAEAVAVAGVMAKQGKSKEDIRKYIEDFYYDLSMTVDDWRDATMGHGKEICQIAVPQAFACFLEGDSFRDVIRNCIYTGGDSDTVAAIAGAIAENYWFVPQNDVIRSVGYLNDELYDIVWRWEEFVENYQEGNI